MKRPNLRSHRKGEVARSRVPDTPSTTTDVFTSDGTWVVPAGVTSAVVELWSGGGGGAGSTSGRGGDGGGGGAYIKGELASLVEGMSFNVWVGSGGSGGDWFGGPGTSGNESSFANPKNETADWVLGCGGGYGGGEEGFSGQGGSPWDNESPNVTILASTHGGNGGLGAISTSGGGGGAAGGPLSNGGNGASEAEGVNTAPSGNGGHGGTTRGHYGEDGHIIGGGGGGGDFDNYSGGAGARGEVRITY